MRRLVRIDTLEFAAASVYLLPAAGVAALLLLLVGGGTLLLRGDAVRRRDVFTPSSVALLPASADNHRQSSSSFDPFVNLSTKTLIRHGVSSRGIAITHVFMRSGVQRIQK